MRISDPQSDWITRKRANAREWEGKLLGDRERVQATLRYANELTRLTCAPDLLALRIFPDFKEVAESFAAYDAVRRHLLGSALALDATDVTLVAVGDGCVPRTAITFAFRTRWSCHSVDPRLRPRVWPVQRLTTHSTCAGFVCVPRARMGVVVAVHSHAHWREALATVSACDHAAMVVLPCCAVNALPPVEPDVVYDDNGIPSPDRTVYVYGPERIAEARRL
jgi:hypothetical protein